MTEKKLTPTQKAEQLEEQVQVLTDAIAKVATLAGYGNHLKEFNIEKWIPTKKDMQKRFTE